jgi:hypothetical protein
MRIVYGAGAVAAMSVMAVGLVQPDWTSTADQGPTDDSYADDLGAVAALPGGKAETGLPDPTPGKVATGVQVRHVTRYIYLRPGQTPPPGATVISATAAPARVPRNHSSGPGATSSPRPPQHNGGGSVTATPRPTQAPAATPRPAPRPTPTTRQSGH